MPRKPNAESRLQKLLAGGATAPEAAPLLPEKPKLPANPCPKNVAHRTTNIERGNGELMWRCLDCFNLTRNNRFYSDDAAGKSKAELFKRDAQIAAYIGAGMGPRWIAKEMGIKTAEVERIVATKVNRDPDLQKVLEAARERLSRKAIDVAERAIETMHKGLNGYQVVAGIDRDTAKPVMATVDCPPQHAATVFRELRPAIGMVEERGPKGGSALHLEVDTNNPEVAVAIVQALRAGGEKRREIELQAERVG